MRREKYAAACSVWKMNPRANGYSSLRSARLTRLSGCLRGSLRSDTATGTPLPSKNSTVHTFTFSGMASTTSGRSLRTRRRSARYARGMLRLGQAPPGSMGTRRTLWSSG